MDIQLSKGQIENIIRERLIKDAKFHRKLMENPKEVLSELLKRNLPGKLKVKVIEEALNVIYLTLPPSKIESGQELSDEMLENIAGGIVEEDVEECHASESMPFASQVSIGQISK